MTDLKTILEDKTLASKARTEALGNLILEGKLGVDEFVSGAGHMKDSFRGTLIEALELASKAQPEIITLDAFHFAVENLGHKAPRVRRESAKVIGNVAHLFSNKLDEAIKQLLINTEDSGTVVRWSAAYALGQIIQTAVPNRDELIEAVRAISERDEKNSIKKVYQAALKKVQQ
ncbi:MAG: hypothetical protein K0R65_1545 [Crocinitomicaceae bacterium]|nr:hypothetical protein [Crocinitomicaceae bacterium]